MKFLSHLSIAVRLFAAFSAVLALLAAVVLLGLNQIDRMGESSRELALRSLENVALVHQAQKAAQTGATVLHSLFLLSRKDRELAYARIDESARIRDRAIKSLSTAEDDAEFQTAVVQMQAAHSEFAGVFEEAIDAIELETPEAKEIMLRKTMPALDKMLQSLDLLVAEQTEIAQETIQGIEKQQAARKQLILVLGFAALLVAGVSALVITRSIANPLENAAKMARDVAAAQARIAGLT